MPQSSTPSTRAHDGSAPPAPPQLACKLRGPYGTVFLVLRSHWRGTELCCLHDERVLWSEVLPHPPADAEVQWAMRDSRAAWEAKGWLCECTSRRVTGRARGANAGGK